MRSPSRTMATTMLALIGAICLGTGMASGALAGPLDSQAPAMGPMQGLQTGAAGLQMPAEQIVSRFSLTPGDTDGQTVTMTLQIEPPRQPDNLLRPVFAFGPEDLAGPDGLAELGAGMPEAGKLKLNTQWSYSPLTAVDLDFRLNGNQASTAGRPFTLLGEKDPVRIGGTGAPMSIDGVALGARHHLNQHWTLLANLAWFKSQDKALFSQSPTPDVIVPVVWDETTRYVLGVIFMPTDRLAIRAKVSLDRPFSDPDPDDIQGPVDQSRLWMAAGVDYQVRNAFSFYLEYTRLAVKDGGPFSYDDAGGAAGATGTASDWSTSLDVIAAMLKIQF